MTVTASARCTGYPGYSESLPRAPQSARAARRLIRCALTVWGLDHYTDDAEVIVSELVANATRHTKCLRIRVTVTRPARDRVRIAVVDSSPAQPVLRRPDGDEEHGRGLPLIESLTDRWGTDVTPSGKRVWGELRTP